MLHCENVRFSGFNTLGSALLDNWGWRSNGDRWCFTFHFHRLGGGLLRIRRRCRGIVEVTGFDFSKRFADLDPFAFFLQDFGQAAGHWRRHLQRRLVGLQHEHVLVFSYGVAFAFQPFGNFAFGD